MGQTKDLLSLLWQLDKPSDRCTITFTTAGIKISRHSKNSTNHCLGQNDFLSVRMHVLLLQLLKSATVVAHTDSQLHFIGNWRGCIRCSIGRRSAVWGFTCSQTFCVQRKRYVANLVLSANIFIAMHYWGYMSLEELFIAMHYWGYTSSEGGAITWCDLPTSISVGEDIPALFPALILTTRLHILLWSSSMLMVTWDPDW